MGNDKLKNINDVETRREVMFRVAEAHPNYLTFTVWKSRAEKFGKYRFLCVDYVWVDDKEGISSSDTLRIPIE